MSNGVSLAFGLVVLALSARYLGPARFGEQAVFRSIAFIALPLLTGGLQVNMAKEIGRDPSGAAAYLGSVVSLRWAIALVTVVAAVVLVRALPLPPERELAGYATALLLLSGMWQMLTRAVYVAYESTEYNLGMSLVSGILTVPLTVFAIRLDTGVAGVLAAAAVAPLFTAQVGFAVACRRFVRPELRVDFVHWRKILRDSLPVGIGALLRRSYARVDVLLLAALRSPEAAGVFSVAYRAAVQVTAASTAVGTAALPRLARLAEVSRERLRAAFEHMLIISLSVSIPVAGMLAALAAPLVTLVAGLEFVPSIAVLRLISIAIVTTIPAALLFLCLVALGKEKSAVRFLAISVAANLILDVLLIPSLGVYGACLGTIGAEWLFFSLSLADMHRELRLSLVWRPLVKLAAAASLMGLAIHFAGPDRALMGAATGMATFLSACLLSRAVPAGTLGALRRTLAARPPAKDEPTAVVPDADD